MELAFNFTDAPTIPDNSSSLTPAPYNPPQPPPFQLPQLPAECAAYDLGPLQILYFTFWPEWLIKLFFIYHSYEVTLFTVIYPIIFIFGVFGNVAFLFTVYKVKEMKTLTNFYLVNISLADLTYLCLQFVRNTISYFYYRTREAEFAFTPVACGIQYGIQYLTSYASMFIITLVSFERFMAICHPLKHRMVNTKKRTIILTSIGYLAAAAMAAVISPAASKSTRFCLIWPTEGERGARYSGYRTGMRFSCTDINYDYAQIVAKFLQFIPFLLTLIINIIFYAKIIIRLSNRAVAGKDEQKEQSNTDKVRNQVARMLILNGVIFFMCLMPFQLLNLQAFINVYLLENKPLLTLEENSRWQWSGRILMTINTALNPYIYSISNVRYRKAFFKAIGMSRPKTPPATSVTLTSTMEKTTM